MDTQLYLLGVAVLALGAFFGALFGVNRLAAKGKNVQQVLATADTVVDGLKAVNDSVGKALLPAPAFNILDKIIQTTQLGVHQAEQLYKSGQLPPDLRKDSAVNFSMDLLKINGIEVTPELEQAIKGVAEAMVFAMPKTNSAQ
jgi:hypothetical protein